jgi:hypothetical protein
MSDERQYDEAEVAEILEQATSIEARAPVPAPAATGLTLAQLQEIGAEVGIPPERIAEAARAVTSRIPAPAPLTFLGAPRSVSRIVPIARALDDDEWTRLVVELRETFGAEGRIRVHGPLRSWSNGNLQVHVEPDGDRYRVRMQTLKGDAYPRATLGAVTMGASAVMFLVNSTGGLRPGGVVVAAVMGLAGLAQLGYLRALLLPRWAAERAGQMEALAERIPRLLDE